ncbi:MAG: thermonuclease family protein [Candidatus Portnoybacteria bacterium]|nr:thermonuclease family protein [Candidatus Portnoybacteria bacterium]
MLVPKSVLLFLLVLIIFSFGIWVGLFFSLSPVQTHEEIQGGNEKENVERNSVIVQYRDASKVARVIDGDTIELENGQRVRYIGIDTPETSDPRKPIQCFGIEAAKKNQELVEGKMVRLEKDVSERDRYARLLRYVYAGDTLNSSNISNNANNSNGKLYHQGQYQCEGRENLSPSRLPLLRKNKN